LGSYNQLGESIERKCTEFRRRALEESGYWLQSRRMGFATRSLWNPQN